MMKQENREEQIWPDRKWFRVEVLHTGVKEKHLLDVALLFVIFGTADVNSASHNSHLRAEDILIINANDPYELSVGPDTFYVRILIPFDLISEMLGLKNVLFECDTSWQVPSAAVDEMRRILRRLLLEDIGDNKTGSGFIRSSLCFQLAGHISRFFMKHASAEQTQNRKKMREDRTRLIDQFILSNFRSDIAIHDLAGELFLSTGHLSRLIKETYGMSFSEYLTWVRLSSAVEELHYSDVTISKIAFDNGFPNLSAFHKAFREEYGCTPAQMRKRLRGERKKEETNSDPIVRERLRNYLWKEEEQLSGHPEGKLEVSIHCTTPEPLMPIWRQVINIGSASDLIRSDVQEHIIILKKTLKFQYARFWTPFTNDLLIDINNSEHEFNFSRLDNIFDFLLDHDIRPFIELANKPKRINLGAQDSLLFSLHGSVESPGNWKELMEEFMRHILMRYGREEISKWYFELWFDMDRNVTDQEILIYTDLFKVTQEVIRKYSSAQFGGSGYHAYANGQDLKKGIAARVREQMTRDGVTPDFVSAYCYPYDTFMENGKRISRQSADRDFVLHSIENLSSESEGRRLLISEWNMTFSDRNILNDSCYRGAWILSNYIRMTGKTCEAACFCGTDRIAEYVDSGDFLFGGTGILNKEGVLKPAAYAIHFLNQLYPMYVAAGENYLVTADGNGSYSIVCHNCRDLDSQYYLRGEDSLDRNHPNRYFADLEQLELLLHIQDAKEGIYQMKTYRLNENSGSVQAFWRQMGYGHHLAKEDIRYVRNACVPSLTMKKITAEEKKLTVDITMEANEIACILLYKI